MPLHQNTGKSIATCLGERVDYAENEEKTEGRYLSSYQCDPVTAQAEFMLTKREYEDKTGRTQGHNVIAYMIRQAFKPGEITPEKANQLGYELGLAFTKGRHAFVVATHTDRVHIHNHIIFNSTNLDATKKFRDFLGSGKAVGRLSDRICLEHGLSIVEKTKRPKRHYGKWLGDKKPVSQREIMRQSIEEILAKSPQNMEDFVVEMESAGYQVKRGKHLAFKAREQKKFLRLRSLGEGYSEGEIAEKLQGKTELKKKKSPQRPNNSLNLIIDIQAKLAQGKGGGYEDWAKKFNLKQMSKTINFLTENDLLSYANLEEKVAGVQGEFRQMTARIRSAEQQMAELSVTRNHIIAYAKTCELYVAYRKAGYSKTFFEAHRADLTLHKAAKEHFTALGLKKLPTVKSLNQEYSQLLTRKKADYKAYTALKSQHHEVLTAKANLDAFLGLGQKKSRQKNAQER